VPSGQAAQLTEATVSNRTARKNLERHFTPLSYSCQCWCAIRI